MKKEQKAFRPCALNVEQRRALEIMQGGGNIFLTGEAGTGKSYLIRYYLDSLKNKNVLVCAPTGIAAIQINGATVHSAFKAPIAPILPGAPPKKALNVVKAADIILIDEISMCRFDLFDFVCRQIARAEEEAGKKKQVIVVGDFYQLAPVMKREDRDVLRNAWQGRLLELSDGFAFIAPCWRGMGFRAIGGRSGHAFRAA